MILTYFKMKRIIFIIIGTFSLILGALGIFIPLLPTTPFLLLSCWMYLRSSRKLYLWVINHRVFGFYIKSYIKYRAVEKKYKIVAILLLWTTIFISIRLADLIWIRVMLLIIAIGVTAHISLLKTLTKEQIMELEKREEVNLNSFENYSL